MPARVVPVEGQGGWMTHLKNILAREQEGSEAAAGTGRIGRGTNGMRREQRRTK